MSRNIPVRVRLALALAVIAACLAFYAVGALAAELSFPTLTGRVVDAAGLLTPDQRHALEAKLKAHEDKTSDQVVVATVPNLQGTTIEDYANRLFGPGSSGRPKPTTASCSWWRRRSARSASRSATASKAR